MRKRRLTCEIEIDETKKVSVKITKLENKGFADSYISNYLNENLETAVAELVAQMIGDEIKASASWSKKRNDILSRIRNEAEKKVRARVNQSENFILPKEIREMKKDKHPLLKMDLHSIKEIHSIGEKYLENNRKIVLEFMDKFMRAYKELGNKPPTLTNIACQMFGEQHTNPNFALKRELEKIEFEFDEILSAVKSKVNKSFSEK
ncbi:MAG: hypothetical protein ACR2MG_20330 [Pyrinomonadaceae bacterium]